MRNVKTWHICQLCVLPVAVAEGKCHSFLQFPFPAEAAHATLTLVGSVTLFTLIIGLYSLVLSAIKQNVKRLTYN